MSEVRLILGDCLSILPTLEAGSVDAVVTDPPYPGLIGGVSNPYGGVASRTNESMTIGEEWGDDITPLREFARIAKAGAICFCSWHKIEKFKEYLGGKPVGLATWYKRNSQPSLRNRPYYQTEFIWLIEYGEGMNWKPIKTFYDIPALQAGCMATERITENGVATHPAQKPTLLMRYLLEACGKIILDPYMGLGSTGLACIQTDHDFIGIEKDPTYFEIARRRIEIAQMQPGLFDAAEAARRGK